MLELVYGILHAYNGMRGLTHHELGMVGAMYELHILTQN